MRQRPPDGLRSTRRSKSFYPTDPALQARMQAAAPVGTYAYFLNEDLDRVMPYSMGHPPRFQARVTGPDALKAGPLIEQAINIEGHRHLFYDSVRDFAATTARPLVFSGPVTYEIDYLYPPDGKPGSAPAGFRLELIAPGTLDYHGRQPIQYIPAGYGGPRDKTGMTYVDLNPATLVTFRLPPAEETKIRKIIKFLRTASALDGTELTLSRDATGTYSLPEHQRKRGELIAKATEPIGWNARDLFKDNHLEPYDTWRRLRFLEFTIGLRDLIIGRLNMAIAQAGERMGFHAAVELEGLATLADVEKAKDDLRSGARSIGDLERFAAQL